MAPTQTKPGVIKDPSVAALFSNKDPENRYRDLREIGHGSFGAVFFAFDREQQETVAIKKMNFSGKQAIEKWNDILKEVSFLNSVKHPHIVDYKSCYLKETTCWLVMEYCIGSAADIVDVLRKGMRESEIAAIISQTLEALVYLHSLNRIHRDIKAGNILLSDHGMVKLADFGSASLSDPAQTFIGTPFFMAPEVILAMDEGHYTESADIWSLGITCIELAERRPPLFSMNAMSALYHIAQNDPPKLAPIEGDQPEWSSDFVSFVDECLQKAPEERMSAKECLNHAFISNQQSPDTIQELINRTKNMVLELDNFQYKKMRKLMYLDEAEGKDSDANCGGSDDYDFQQHERLSIGKACDSASSRSASITSFRSMQSSGGASHLVSTSTNGGDSSNQQGNGSSTTSGRRRPPIPSTMMQPSSSAASTNSSSCAATAMTTTTIAVSDATVTSTEEEEVALEKTEPIRLPVKDLHMPTNEVKERIETLQSRKFATLRPQKLINREQEEYTGENNLYEQMTGYKRLRQLHHKELRQFEEKCTQERETLRLKLDKELEQLSSTYAKEKQRVRMAHNNEIEKKKKEIEEGERKMKKHAANNQQQQMKMYSSMQLKEYKSKKEAEKMRLKSMNMMKSAYESAVKDVKAELNRIKQNRENDYEQQLQEQAEEELIGYRRNQLGRLHALEEQLDTEDMNVQERQMDTKHAVLMKQHQMTKDLELSHLNELHAMKRRHQEAQHEAESNNQNEYTKRQQEELKKKHALQCRQQPKELKMKEAQIRKQYRQAMKTQGRQFKIFLTQMTQSAPKEQQKEITQRLKEDQTKRLASLTAQYESQVKNMVRDKTVKLESWQVDEQNALSQKLEKELEELIVYQKKQCAQLEEQIAKERENLDQRIGTRRAALEMKMKQNNEDLSNLRRIKKEQMKERHASERQQLENSFVRKTGGARSGSSSSRSMGASAGSSVQLAM